MTWSEALWLFFAGYALLTGTYIALDIRRRRRRLRRVPAYKFDVKAGPLRDGFSQRRLEAGRRDNLRLSVGRLAPTTRAFELSSWRRQ